MIEFYRQFAFVSSVLAGFAFAFYGTLLLAPSPHRTASWAALLSVSASVSFLLATLATTFSAAAAANLKPGASLPASITNQLPLISMLLLSGVLLLLASFGLGGWVRSRKLGIATTTLAAAGAIGVFIVMSPFLRVQ